MTTPLTILLLLIVRPKLLLRWIQSMRTVPTTPNSLATCVFLTTNVPMEPSSLTEQVLLTSETDSEPRLQKTASALASLMSAARILTLFLHHHHQLSNTKPSAEEETSTVSEPESRVLPSLSLSLENGLICVLSSTPSL